MNIHLRKEDTDGGDLIIRNGEILNGVLAKKDYQTRTYGLVHTVYNEDGPEARPHIDDPWADLGEPLGVGLQARPVAHAKAWSGPARRDPGDPVTGVNQRRSDYR